MKLIRVIFIFLIFISLGAKADDGMWIPLLLKKYNIEDMKKAGFKLSAEDIYSINEASIKDAVLGICSKNSLLSFTGTASFISESGLVLTNQHTIVSALHELCTVENNYLQKGFYAALKEEELPAQRLRLARLVRMEDVTASLIGGLAGTDENAKNREINKRAKKIVAEAIKGTHYKAKVSSYFGGGQYFLEVYEVYNDVRFVAVPPLSIGKFGGEADNWKWPRQSADFSILRVYGNDKNISDKYSVSNTPIKPTYSLKLSKKGYKEGDFTMVVGFPGSTKQFLTARALQQLVDVKHHHAIKIRDAKMDILNRNMAKSEELWLKYADFAGKTSNYLLRWKGESGGIKRLGLIDIKKAEEKKFTEWANASEDRQKKYGDLIPKIESFCNQLDSLEKLNVYVIEAGIRGANLTSFVGKFDMLRTLSTHKRFKAERLEKERKRLEKECSEFFKKYDLSVEKEMVKKFTQLYVANTGDQYHSDFLKESIKKYNGDISKLVDEAFEQSIFGSEKKIKEFVTQFKKEEAKIIDEDPIFQLSIGYFLANRDIVMRQRSKIRRKYAVYHKRYVQANKEMKKDGKLAADANRSLRVSYGNVKGFKKEKEQMPFAVDFSSMIKKHTTDSKTYPLPKEFANWGTKYVETKKKTVPTCFITNAHTTGGNSGSPVLDAKGRLIGVNFDSVDYGLVSDYRYMPECSRHISVDVRYIRFILEHFFKADSLLKEWKK